MVILRALLAAACLFAAGAVPVPAADAAPRTARVEHVVLVSMDGLRPDVALRADMKNLRSLMDAGAFSFWARTTAVSVTLPSHTSMVTGVPPDEHEIEWNRDMPFSSPVYPSYPTVMELATRAGKTSAMAAGKSKFSVLNKPGTIAQVFVPTQNYIDDATVGDHAVEMIARARPTLLFVHLPGVDIAGHTVGWGSPAQLRAAEGVDAQLGRILAALDAAGIRGSTAVLVSADHGGAGLTHGADDPRSRHIPWILSGPGVRRGFDLTRKRDLEIHTEDSAATICYLLGLDCGNITGRPVLAAFEKP
jgi:predicted AlkP superfamily pyrophosphatase or phosphodiesterase